MNHIKASLYLKFIIGASLSAALLNGCTGGSTSVTATGSSAGGEGEIVINKIQNTNLTAITASNSDGGGYLYTSSATVTITGTCGRGTDKIVASIVRDNGGTGAPAGAVVATEEATCSNTGEFSWSKGSMLGGSAVTAPVATGLQYSITLSTKSVDGTTLDSEVAKVNVDDVAPIAPIMNTTSHVTSGSGTCTSSNPYSCESSSDSELISIYVDIPADGEGLVSSRGTVAFSSGVTYIVSETLPGDGSVNPYTMTTQDKAGNVSNGLAVSVSFNTTLLPPVINIGGGTSFNGSELGYTSTGNLGSIGVFAPTSVASPSTSFQTDIGSLAN